MGKPFLTLIFLGGCATGPMPGADAAGVSGPGAAAPATRVSIPNAAQPLPGVLTGGQPDHAQFSQAAAAGYGTVISLRTSGEAGTEEEQATVEGLGMRFVSIPVSGPVDLTEDNARALATAMEAAGDKPMLIHCGTGNRAGALLALKAYHVDGQSAEDALVLGARAGLTKLFSVVRERMHRE